VGEIELVADPAENPDDWLVKKRGGGIMMLELKVFGRLFISERETDEHLTFASRQTKRWWVGCWFDAVEIGPLLSLVHAQVK
jgi:hypothetical protein